MLNCTYDIGGREKLSINPKNSQICWNSREFWDESNDTKINFIGSKLRLQCPWSRAEFIKHKHLWLQLLLDMTCISSKSVTQARAVHTTQCKLAAKSSVPTSQTETEPSQSHCTRNSRKLKQGMRYNPLLNAHVLLWLLNQHNITSHNWNNEFKKLIKKLAGSKNAKN